MYERTVKLSLGFSKIEQIDSQTVEVTFESVSYANLIDSVFEIADANGMSEQNIEELISDVCSLVDRAVVLRQLCKA